MRQACLAPTGDPWMEAMRRGDFAAAWKISDAVLQRRAHLNCCHWPRHLQFVWRGQPLTGRHVLVRCYHGLGDTLQFVRFAAPLRRVASGLTLWVQPALLPLMTSVQGVDRCLPLHDGSPDVDFDVDIELMEIPHALRIGLDDVGGHVPYIHPPSLPCAPREENLRVGIAWKSGDWNPQRSLPPAVLSRLNTVSGVRFFSLQYGEPPPAGLQAADLSCRDIARMAARMQQLDLIISVDTMVAHLAGAMGLPVWTLLCSDCDWRWLDSRSDTPWYPSMRLFRQRVPGNWHDVLDKLLPALEARARTRGAESKSRVGQSH